VAIKYDRLYRLKKLRPCVICIEIMVLDLPNAPGLPDVFIISVKSLEHKTAISLGPFNFSTVYTKRVFSCKGIHFCQCLTLTNDNLPSGEYNQLIPT
jgi:hypothetical protein